MPNHCENRLTLLGSESEVARCLEFIKGEPLKDFDNSPIDVLFDCGKVIPYPDNYRKMDEEDEIYHGAGFNAGGYQWCITNWGTKWGAYDTYLVDRTPELAVIEFNSAWSPPSPVVSKLAEFFPNLSITLEYEEPGCDFSGREEYADGALNYQVQGDFDEYPISDHSWMHEDEEEEEEDAVV